MPTIRWPSAILISALPVLAAVLVYQLDSFNPAAYPEHEMARRKPSPRAPNLNSNMLRGSEKIGQGQLLAPEDIAFDPNTGVIYTGCQDGWLSRVTINGSPDDAMVEKWVNTGGRPLGIIHGLHGEVIVADAYKGLLNVTRTGAIELLADEAEGLKFKLTDAVDVGPNGILYFTDASYKYALEDGALDLLEGRPNGRFLSYDPKSKQTRVLLRDLYFPNGVVVSPDQSFVIFCETPMRRCKKYYIQGEKTGSVDIFVENLPGLPDNIRYDGEGTYWISLIMDEYFWEMMVRYPILRKVAGILEKYGVRPNIYKNAGVVAVDLDGNLTAYYHDSEATRISTGIKIGEHLYFGSIVYPYIIRLNVSQYPASPAA